jgi:hypothetical protein
MAFNFTKISIYPAVGGPDKSYKDAKGNMADPTREGRYVIHSIDKYISNLYGKDWSGIKWGTPMRLKNDIVQINLSGKWVDLSKYDRISHWYYGTTTIAQYEALIKKTVEAYHKKLYGVEKVPDSWIFNDFGHKSIRYFKDLNSNFLFDQGKEDLMSDLLHTTPVDEANIKQGKPVLLSTSHGCIHVRPDDLDEIIQKGFVKKGQVICIHSYTELTYPLTFTSEIGKPPYELHFFPGCKTKDPHNLEHTNKGIMVVYTVTQL